MVIKTFSDFRRTILNNVVIAIIAIVTAAGINLLIPAQSAWAQFAEDTCDPNYLESLEARAWLEAQREITQNQNLILKPDSVLEYTCFDQHLNQVAESATQLFSESDRWGGPPSTITQDLNAIAASYRSYQESNFSHKFLGGRVNNDNFDGNNDGSTAPPNSVTAGTYNCEVMNAVWEVAKCLDFIQEGRDNTDGFFTFAEYNTDTQDKRVKPDLSQCNKLVNFGAKMNEATADQTVTPWVEDNLKTYFSMFRPGEGSANTCGMDNARIATGLMLDGDTAEYICLVPGCYNSGTRCVRP